MRRERCLTRRVRTLTGAVLLALLVSTAAAEQQEDPEKVIVTGVASFVSVDADNRVSTFTLVISGRGFGTDSTHLQVEVNPQEDIQGSVDAVGAVRDDRLIAQFRAVLGFAPETLVVTRCGRSSEPFVLTEEEEGCPKGVCVYRSVMDPKNASDVFGKRIAKRFVIIQVTITNRSREFNYLIHDLSLDLRDLGTDYDLSSRELGILRGVAEKGQLLDLRNVVLRALEGAGTIASGLVWVGFGRSYARGVATFEGPLITAYKYVFPDFTFNQLIRLNDSAYVANTVVPRQQAKVVVVFLPQAIFLTKKQRKKFWDEPTSLWEKVDLRKLEILVDGNHITEVDAVPPAVVAAIIAPDELMKFKQTKPEVRGAILGRFLAGSTISLLNENLQGLSVEVTGPAKDNRLEFLIKSDRPVAPNTNLRFGIAKGGEFKEASVKVRYQASAPTLNSIEPAEGTAGTSVDVTLQGTNFLPGATSLAVSGGGVRMESVEVSGVDTITGRLVIEAGAAAGPRDVTVKTPGGTAGPITFTVTEPPQSP